MAELFFWEVWALEVAVAFDVCEVCVVQWLNELRVVAFVGGWSFAALGTLALVRRRHQLLKGQTS